MCVHRCKARPGVGRLPPHLYIKGQNKTVLKEQIDPSRHLVSPTVVFSTLPCPCPADRALGWLQFPHPPQPDQGIDMEVWTAGGWGFSHRNFHTPSSSWSNPGRLGWAEAADIPPTPEPSPNTRGPCTLIQVAGSREDSGSLGLTCWEADVKARAFGRKWHSGGAVLSLGQRS